MVIECAPARHFAPQRASLHCDTRLCDGVRSLLLANCSQLADPQFVAQLAREVGMVPDPRGCRLYGEECAAAHEGEAAVKRQDGMYQDPVQLAEVLHFLRGGGVQSYVEVGINGGWTSGFITAFLLRHSPSRQVTSLAVDRSDRRAASTRRLFDSLDIRFALRQHPTDLRLAMHKRWPQLANARHSVDLCFIDGDHSYGGVRLDYEMVADLCRLVMFHDIMDWDSFDFFSARKDKYHGVPAFWAHLKANVNRARVREFTAQAAIFPPTLGIGLLLPGSSGTAALDENFSRPWLVGGSLGAEWGVPAQLPAGFLCNGCSTSSSVGRRPPSLAHGRSVAAVDPLPVPRASHAAHVAARLNERFRNGVPTGDFARAGVVYRGIGDALSPGWSAAWRRAKRANIHATVPEPWRVDPHYRTDVSDRFSVSIMNARLPYYYHGSNSQTSAGLVVAPSVAGDAALCLFPEDVSSVNRTCVARTDKCIPGCVTPADEAWKWCEPHQQRAYRGGAASNPSSCAWRPAQLQEMMVLHEIRRDTPSFKGCLCCSWPKCPLCELRRSLHCRR
ncbi:hypothetical protein AB1Y20_014552 [Prymnesium parvum]|uniref:Uncharacterized protein n=1 Tax=Prymnesium parvum TaxID=97485 RepID=A0AB34IDX8_PRYPA